MMSNLGWCHNDVQVWHPSKVVDEEITAQLRALIETVPTETPDRRFSERELEVRGDCLYLTCCSPIHTFWPTVAAFAEAHPEYTVRIVCTYPDEWLFVDDQWEDGYHSHKEYEFGSEDSCYGCHYGWYEWGHCHDRIP